MQAARNAKKRDNLKMRLIFKIIIIILKNTRIYSRYLEISIY